MSRQGHTSKSHDHSDYKAHIVKHESEARKEMQQEKTDKPNVVP